MPRKKNKNDQNGNGVVNSNGNIFAHLSAEKQAEIQDFVALGWSILKNENHTWDASKELDGNSIKLEDFGSLDVLLIEVGKAEAGLGNGADLLDLITESADEAPTAQTEQASNDFNDIAAGLDADNLIRLRELEAKGWEFGINKEHGTYFASKSFPEQKRVELIDGFETVEALIYRVEGEELLDEATAESGQISEDEDDDFDADEFSEIDSDDEPDRRPRFKPTKRNLKVRLTAREQQERASSYFETLNQIEDAAARFKAVKDEHNANIKFMTAQAQRLRHAADSGFEYRDVPCREEFDYDRSIVIVVRTDTGETVESRPMSDKERQMPLPTMRTAEAF